MSHENMSTYPIQYRYEKFVQFHNRVTHIDHLNLYMHVQHFKNGVTTVMYCGTPQSGHSEIRTPRYRGQFLPSQILRFCVLFNSEIRMLFGAPRCPD